MTCSYKSPYPNLPTSLIDRLILPIEKAVAQEYWRIWAGDDAIKKKSLFALEVIFWDFVNGMPTSYLPYMPRPPAINHQI